MTSSHKGGGGLGVGTLVSILVVVIIGMALLPTIIGSTDSGVSNLSLGGYDSAATLLGLLPLFFVIGILVMVVLSAVEKTRHL